jgi:hypothetical protein
MFEVPGGHPGYDSDAAEFAARLGELLISGR